MAQTKLTEIINSEDSRQRFIGSLNRLEIVKPIVIEMSYYRPKRSLAQNRLFHLWMRVFADHYYASHDDQHSPAAWKIYFKNLFLGETILEINGMQIVNTRETSKLNIEEMSAFLLRVDHYCMDEFLCDLPHPDDLFNDAMGSKL